MSTFGEELRRERKLRRIALREVAEATKINLRYLEALERNEFQHLPGGVFNRGFVRAYAQYIGVDPDAMVNAYLLEEQDQADQGKAQDRHLFRRSQKRAESNPEAVERAKKPSGRPIRWFPWLALAIAVALLLGWLAFKYLRGGDDSTARQQEVSAPKGDDLE
jgi:cytoskeletal protein RodZ